MVDCKTCGAKNCDIRGWTDDPEIATCYAYRPMTNGDKIRNMTDEELCDFILEKRENGSCFNNRCYVHDPNKGCDDCTMEWLKQPYKESEADGS